MKLRYVVALAAPMVVTGASRADYLGLGVQLHTTVTIDGVARDVWRVYAVFDNEGDWLYASGGSAANGKAAIKNTDAGGVNSGTGFFNVGGSSKAPSWSSGVGFVNGPNSEWDTYVTIGTTKNDINTPSDDVSLSPLFHSFTPGQDTVQWGPFSNDAWFILVQPQGMAGNGVAGTFFNHGSSLEGMGVLMMQLTVNAGQNAEGTVFVSGEFAKGGANFTATGQTFATIPSPGVLAAVGLAGLMVARRRRR